DVSIFKGFIQTGPFSLEKWRQRQMGKAVGRGFCGQGIDGIEQGISGASETAVDLVTKFVQYVKVQLSNAPSLFLEHYSFGPVSARGWPFSLNSNASGGSVLDCPVVPIYIVLNTNKNK